MYPKLDLWTANKLQLQLPYVTTEKSCLHSKYKYFSGGRTKHLQVLLFTMLNLVIFQILFKYMTDGSSVRGHVIQGICADGAQLSHFNMVTL